VLGLPKHKIVVKVKRIGGSFGGKERMLNACLASVAANKVGRPVRLIFSRNEDTEVSGHRHESIVEYNVDYYKDGRMAKTALRAHVNAGCSVDLTPVYSFFLVHRLSGAYSYTEFDSKATAYRTNTPSNTPVRGMGGPEGAVVIDTILDHIAHSLSMRPEMVREINLCRDGEVNLLGDGVMEGISVHDCWSECKRIGKYDKKQKEINEFNQASVRVKRGLSLVPMKFVTSTLAKFLMKGSAMVRIYTDGSVLLSHSGVETGQGLHTKMIQVASRSEIYIMQWLCDLPITK
jgi:xanthine dehydrogenase molybdopterin-binding subunit B